MIDEWIFILIIIKIEISDTINCNYVSSLDLLTIDSTIQRYTIGDEYSHLFYITHK